MFVHNESFGDGTSKNGIEFDKAGKVHTYCNGKEFSTSSFRVGEDWGKMVEKYHDLTGFVFAGRDKYVVLFTQRESDGEGVMFKRGIFCNSYDYVAMMIASKEFPSAYTLDVSKGSCLVYPVEDELESELNYLSVCAEAVDGLASFQLDFIVGVFGSYTDFALSNKHYDNAYKPSEVKIFSINNESNRFYVVGRDGNEYICMTGIFDIDPDFVFAGLEAFAVEIIENIPDFTLEDFANQVKQLGFKLTKGIYRNSVELMIEDANAM